MRHPAALAADEMEKKGAVLSVPAAILAALALAPTVTRGLNRLTGYDPTKKIEKAKRQQQQQQVAQSQQPSASTSISPRQQTQTPWMAQQAAGLRSYRAGA